MIVIEHPLNQSSENIMNSILSFVSSNSESHFQGYREPYLKPFIKVNETSWLVSAQDASAIIYEFSLKINDINNYLVLEVGDSYDGYFNHAVNEWLKFYHF